MMKRLRMRSSSQRWFQIVLSIVTISSLLAGCRLPWQPAQETPGELPEGGQAAAPLPTDEPRKDLPPALVEVSPVPESFIGLNQPISLYFNQPMDADSVEAAIRFEPRISGRFSWEGDQKVTFIPDQGLSPGSDLHLAINTSAQAVNQKNLQEAVEFDYQTAENLQVVQVLPSDGTQDVDPESIIFTAFNQPVVALGADADAEPAFTLSPEVLGEGEWINTSTYAFRPDPSMGGGTDYTISLNPSLTATSGAGLDSAQESQFTFTTTQPTVLNVYPSQGEKLSLDGPVEVQFNIRMDPESVESHFTLMDPDQNAISGEFEWDPGFKLVSFHPETRLARNTSYTIALGEGAKSFGGLSVLSSYEVSRTTFPVFSLSTTDLPDFQSYYGQYGQYKVQFTTPIEKDGYQDSISISPEVNAENIFLSDGGKSILISGYFEPETSFTFRISADLVDAWGGRLGEQVQTTFFTPPAAASLSAVTGPTSNNLVFVPADASELVVQATNINTIRLELSPIRVDELITLLHPDNYDYRQTFLPEELAITTQTLNLTRNVSEIVTIPLSYEGEPLEPGVYYLGISSPEIIDEGMQNTQKLYLVVSENNLVMKIAPQQAFVYANQLDDYDPLVDVPVSIYNTEGNQLTSGRTDSTGIFINDIPGFDDPYAGFFALVGEPGQPEFAFSVSTWDQGFALYQMGIPLNTLPRQMYAYIYTDRPIYRPGDTVHFKAALFSRENGIPKPAGLDTVSVAMYGDPGMSGIPLTLFSEDLSLNQFGTIAESVTLPDDAPPGMYRIELKNGDTFIESFYFDVAAYRKPEIEVSVVLDPSELTAGEGLSAEIQADYYFGMPASDQPISWRLYRDPANFNLAGYQVGPSQTGWLMPRISDVSPLGTVVAEGEGSTDEAGNFALNFSPADLDLDFETESSMQKINLEVTVMDESGAPVSHRASAMIHPEDFYMGVQPESYFGNAETPFNFSILTVDWEGDAIGGIPIAADFEAIDWEVEETNNPEMPYRYVPQTTLIASANPVTAVDGQARVSFTPPEPGTYQVTLKSGDAVTQALVWVSGEGSPSWPRQPQNQIKLTTDSDHYQPGQIAQVFFPNPFPDQAKALVTIERGNVMESQVLDIEQSGQTLSIPINQDAVPNIYVSVMLFGFTEDGVPDYRQGVTNLSVDPISQSLNVELTIDPTRTEPGGRVSARLKITDHQGEPVQGEFSIAVVDKAVLALLADNSQPILEAFYGNSPLSVQTSISLKTYAAQLMLSSMDLGRGGGGDMMVQQTIRQDFPDTAFWEGQVVTGVDGRAQFEIPMPDSLTTWVVDVRGLTENYQVGQAEAEILTQKDLMIRPVTPRFLVDGDQVEMAAVVHNNTAEGLDVDVSLQGTGFTLTEEGERIQAVTLEPGGSERVTWRGSVESVETVDLVFEAVAGSLSDASMPVWGELDVLRYAMPYTFSTAGQLSQEGERLELVSLPISSDPSSGTLSVELTPSLTTSLVEGLQALEASPYDDTVSTLSRLLANVNAYAALNSLGIESPNLESDLADMAGESIRQLVEAQNPDGGWSWWREPGSTQSSSDAFITAYVLLGLEQSSRAGLDVGRHFIDFGMDFLSSQLMMPGDIDTPWMLDRLVFQTYALRSSDIALTATMDGLYARRSELQPWAVALLALTIQERDGSRERVNTLLGDLEASAVRSATGVHWESDQPSWLLPGTPIFNTSVGVFALSQLDPASTSVSLALQYLMKNRHSGGLWDSTFESAWVLMALTEALQGTGDYQADFDFKAALNDKTIAEGTGTGTTPLTSVTAVTAIDALHQASPNALVIERNAGAGTLYYRADLQTYQPAGKAEALNRGIRLDRAYYLAGEGCPGAEDCKPIESLQWDMEDPSQLVTTSLTVILAHDMYNLMLEDFIPAGTEVLNRDLLTSQTTSDVSQPIFDPRAPFESGWGWWFFNDPQIYDDRVLWTADYVPAGTYTLTYQLVPTHRGAFQVIPAQAWQYFYPEVQGTSPGSVFTIE